MAAEEVPSVQFAILSREGFQVYAAQGSNVKKIDGFAEEGALSFDYSRDGSRVAVR